MPPRKSNVSATSAGDDGATPAKERDGVNIEDLSLPRTMVQRLAKGVLPANTMLSKDAVLAMQKAATVFVNHIAAQANDTTMASNRRTIPPGAVFEALRQAEFEAFIPRVQAELEKYTHVQANKRNDYRRKLKETKDGSDPSADQSANHEMDEDGDGERGAKRVRVSEGGEESRTDDQGNESPSAQLRTQAPRREWNPDEDPDDAEQGDEDIEEDGGGVTLDGTRDDDEGNEEGEEEEEDDDADAYPDEGHRAESLEMDDPDEEDEKERRRRFAYGPSGEGGGGGGTSESEDEETSDA